MNVSLLEIEFSADRFSIIIFDVIHWYGFGGYGSFVKIEYNRSGWWEFDLLWYNLWRKLWIIIKGNH